MKSWVKICDLHLTILVPIKIKIVPSGIGRYLYLTLHL